MDQSPCFISHQVANMMAMQVTDIHNTLDMKQAMVIPKPQNQGSMDFCFQP